MQWFLMRHGRDPEDFRGGWSSHSLTEQGRREVVEAAKNIQELDFELILSSDLARARETAEIIARVCKKPLYLDVALREINNGDLAGLANDLAEKKYPNLYYKNLAFTESYPNGESPKAFFERMKQLYENMQAMEKNCLFITHGGVIEALYCLHEGLDFSNKTSHIKLDHAEVLTFTF